MAAQESLEVVYEVVVWDYDAAPGAAEYWSDDYSDEERQESILPYYCCKRRTFIDLEEAKYFAWYEVESERGRMAVGAAVFLNGKEVWGIGSLTFRYRERYL